MEGKTVHVADRLLDEGLRPMEDALRAEGIQVEPEVGKDWARRGIRGIKLEAFELGGRFHTSPQALRRFLRAVADAEAAALSRRRRARQSRSSGGAA